MPEFWPASDESSLRIVRTKKSRCRLTSGRLSSFRSTPAQSQKRRTSGRPLSESARLAIDEMSSPKASANVCVASIVSV
jgi:hypothetical protein